MKSRWGVSVVRALMARSGRRERASAGVFWAPGRYVIVALNSDSSSTPRACRGLRLGSVGRWVRDWWSVKIWKGMPSR